MSTLAPEAEVDLPLLEAAEAVAAPFINLLPPEIAERRALRRLGTILIAALVFALAVTGGLVYLAGSGKSDAQAALANQTAQTARLQQQVRSLDSARQAQAQLQAAKAALQAAMANEVLWSKYLDTIRGKLPDGVRLSNVAIAPAGAAAAGSSASGAPTPSTTTTSGAASGTGVSSNAVASITISGKAVSQDAVASWLEALGTVDGFTNTYLTSTAADTTGGVVTFTVTVDVTPGALSHRFDSPAGS